MRCSLLLLSSFSLVWLGMLLGCCSLGLAILRMLLMLVLVSPAGSNWPAAAILSATGRPGLAVHAMPYQLI